MKAIINGKLLLPNAQGEFSAVQDKVLLFTDKIVDIIASKELKTEKVSEVVDAAGNYVSPGFINVHIHGCVGADTMDDDVTAIAKMQVFQASTGVTSFLPTTMTYDFATIGKALENVRLAMKRSTGARVLGAHMEGPFISPQKNGAQAAKNIVKADFSLIKSWQDVIKIVTLAPEELPANSKFIAKCKQVGIIVSIGHTAANYEQAIQAINEHGVTHVTHLFNAMTGLHHREPGVVGAALDTNVNCELIVDNVHVCPAMQRLVYHAKQRKNIILITDSLRACGLGDGPSELGGQKVIVKDNLATLVDDTIAGSVLQLNRGLKIFSDNTNITAAEVVPMVTKTPAEELGIYDTVGSLEVGKQADITIFDKAFNIKRTYRDGECVYLGENKSR